MSLVTTKKIVFVFLSIFFLGTVSVLAGNTYVNENGVRSSFISSGGNFGASFNLTVIGADGQNYTLVYENGIVINDPTNVGEEENETNITTMSTSGLITDLVAYYKLDETSGTVIDSTGSYNGTNNGATPNVAL